MFTCVHTDAMTDLDIQELANLTAGDADVDNFERLFSKLKEMKGNWGMKRKGTTLLFLVIFKNLALKKTFSLLWWRSNTFTAGDIYDALVFSDFQPADKASSLPHEQRKVHAEKVCNCRTRKCLFS